MINHECSDAIVYVCHNCIPQKARLPRQWTKGGIHVQVRALPCTGKTSTQYIFHALEGGCRGVCVVACPYGDCRLSQGNYRAEIRINNVRRLLAETGFEPDRAQLIHFSKDDDPCELEELLNDVIQKFVMLGESPVLYNKEKVLVN